MGLLAQGSEATAYVIEIEENGDLVDLRYFCYSDAPYDGTNDVYLAWPAYEWGDNCEYCQTCMELLNVGNACECGGKQHAPQ